jgi:hypothetical protein
MSTCNFHAVERVADVRPDFALPLGRCDHIYPERVQHVLIQTKRFISLPELPRPTPAPLALAVGFPCAAAEDGRADART